MKNIFNKKKNVNPPEKTPSLRVAKNIYYKQVFKKGFTIIGYMLIVFMIVYSCFALTIIRVVPTNNEVGLIPVKNTTYSGGIIPANEKMVVNMKTEQNDTITSRLRQSFLMNTDVSLVKVKAGPYGKISWNNKTGEITVQNKKYDLIVRNQPMNKYLEGEYLVECVKGACQKGEGYIVSENNFYGMPISGGKEK